MIDVSTRYVELKPDEVAGAYARCQAAWQDERIPQMQYDLCVKPELEQWTKGQPIGPFDALIRCFDNLDVPSASVLEVGASSGFNREVLKRLGLGLKYRALDSSPAFQRLAKKIWPDIQFDVGDALQLPYSAGSFDVVISGCVILQLLDYRKAIAETSRVASQYAIFHRTPVWDEPTTWYLKEGYGVPMVECCFNGRELLELLSDSGLPVIETINVYPGKERKVRNYSYLCKKGLFHHSV